MTNERPTQAATEVAFARLYNAALDVSDSIIDPERVTPPVRQLRAALDRFRVIFEGLIERDHIFAAVREDHRDEDHPTAEAGSGAAEPSSEDASKAEEESRPIGVPSASAAPPNFVSSVRVERKGIHDHVTVWIRGQNVGTLVMGDGDGDRFVQLLQDGAFYRATAEMWCSPPRDLVPCTENPVKLGGTLRPSAKVDTRRPCPDELGPDERTSELARMMGYTPETLAKFTGIFIAYWQARGTTAHDWQHMLRRALRQRRADA